MAKLPDSDQLIVDVASKLIADDLMAKGGAEYLAKLCDGYPLTEGEAHFVLSIVWAKIAAYQAKLAGQLTDGEHSELEQRLVGVVSEAVCEQSTGPFGASLGASCAFDT